MICPRGWPVVLARLARRIMRRDRRRLRQRWGHCLTLHIARPRCAGMSRQLRLLPAPTPHRPAWLGHAPGIEQFGEPLF